MLFKSIFVWCVVVLPAACLSQKNIPPEAEVFYQQAMKEIKPIHASWIKKTGNNVKTQDEAMIARAVADYAKPINLNNQDILAITYLVMIEAAKIAREDLKAIMEEMNKINKAKEKLRGIEEELKGSNTAISRKKFDSLKTESATIVYTSQNENKESTTVPVKDRIPTLTTPQVGSKELSSFRDTVKNRLDSLSEMGEMESLRLQMAMDRLSKLMSTLGNIMKKVSDTGAGITENLK